VWIIDRISTTAAQIVERVTPKKQNRAQGAV
jgi:hypothetical protein